VHGTLTARIHLAGPLSNLGITGRLDVSDVHRWDLMPGKRSGMAVEPERTPGPDRAAVRITFGQRRQRAAPALGRLPRTDYLSQPHWGIAMNWNRFPVPAILELARHMGAQLPPKLQVSGSMDGALGYSGQGSLQGGLSFHDAVLTVPDSPPVRFEQAHVIFDHGHARLSPAMVRGGEHDEARLEADWSLDDATLDLQISTDGMQVQSLRAQVALANVPGLEQLTAGAWSGGLRFQPRRRAIGLERTDRS